MFISMNDWPSSKKTHQMTDKDSSTPKTATLRKQAHNNGLSQHYTSKQAHMCQHNTEAETANDQHPNTVTSWLA